LDLTDSQPYNGDPVHLWQCNGSNDQRWFYDPESQQIRSGDDFNYCLDAGDPVVPDGQLQVSQCNAGTSQQWMLGQGPFITLFRFPDLCADIRWDPPYYGDPVTNGSCSTDSDTQWIAESG
jgi:hypothetical protein